MLNKDIFFNFFAHSAYGFAPRSLLTLLAQGLRPFPALLYPVRR